MSFLWKRTRGEDGKPVLHKVDMDALRVTSPTLIYLSGFLTTDDQPGFVSGSIKRMEELVGGHAESNPGLNIYSWSYGKVSDVFRVMAYNMRPSTYSSPDGRAIAEKIILPLVTESVTRDAQGRIVGGKLLPDDVAAKNLKNLTFFAFSAGSALAQQVYNASLQAMLRAGFEKTRARGLLSQVALVAVGNVSRPTKEKERFTTLYLVGNNDIVTRAKNRVYRALNLRSVFERFSRKLKVRDLSKTSLLVSAPTPRKLWEWRVLADGRREKQPIRALFPKWLQIRSHHELAHFITRDDGHSQFSQIAMHALLNATNRAEAPDARKMLRPATKPDAPETDAYRQRIAAAELRLPAI
jgi:hypothetical protein